MFREKSKELLEFIEASPSCFHVIHNIKKRLVKEKFIELREEKPWILEYGKNYYITRNDSTIIAFKIPRSNWNGFQIAASHSDFPSFKIKENPEIHKEEHYTCLNVEKYGGMLFAPWMDRPLSVAGRVIIKKDQKIECKLVNVDRDLLMIPNVAIHMNRKANEEMKYNPQVDMIPLLGDERIKDGWNQLIAKEIGVKEKDIISSDLFLYNRMSGTMWGAEEEYISSRSLDDLQCAFGTMEGFVKTENKNRITMCCIFDNEEVGSGTKQGADSTMLSDVMERICGCMNKTIEERMIAISNSFLLSADNGHAVHPNHPEKADPTNRPYPNMGVVIKYNANQKYTTDAVSAGIFKKICEKAEVPVQTYMNRSDIPGGSTLGNIANRHVSLNTVDIGLAQLAMHSCYETGGVKDTLYLIKACETYFKSSITITENGSYEIQL